MPTRKLVQSDATKISDLRQAKSAWSRRLLKPEGPTAFTARGTSSAPTPSENVVGVGVGEKIAGGQLTGVMAVKFFVRIKYPHAQIGKGEALPKTISGLPVDVEETGAFRAFAMPNPKAKTRPAQPGCSVGYRAPGDAYKMAGTFGALVKKGSDLHILSNNHVLADENRLKIGSPIYQPGILDGGSVKTDQVAALSAFVKLRSTANTVDAAIAKAESAALVKKDVLFIGPPAGPGQATINMNVHKFGRTTSYTVGRVTSVETDVTVGYETGNYIFADQIIIVSLTSSPFSKAGDSGSLILERDTQKAVGLLFAGSDTHTIANHIEEVLKALKVKLA